ncbi:hypothetical protein HO133_004824 [Letharia lupina]|uniref:DUF7730 domain-containing protein n=1 Tax=Letharia lupina TaxID=560253 RepID=A0A8H6FL33_9LECA|nr:uncharacterized protein HO133_004824 [Letharia lupina]KAF6230480.1 hypothetical protein HO133_004824 [Letharia lupina]
MFEINKLPRELRDGIYEAAVVGDVVIVAATELQKCENTSRSTWQILKVPQLGERESTRQESTKNSVTNPYHRQCSTEDAPNLNLVHTSHEVYAECWPIFHKQDIYDFTNAETTVTAASMCLAYLNDQSQQALLPIRKMHLIIGQPLYHEDGGLIPRPLLAPAGLTLVLSVNGTVPSFKTINPGNGGLQPWVQEICQITNLRKLEVDVNVTADKVYYVGLDVGLELINHLRARMLANGSGLEKVGLEEFLYTKKVVGCLAWVAVSNYALLKKLDTDGDLVRYSAELTGDVMEYISNVRKESLS